MAITIEAIYENGVLKPMQPLPLKDHERVEITISDAATTEPNCLIAPQLMAELQQAADRAANGLRDPQILAQACERMDQRREEIRRQHGILDIGVPAIRELRDGE